jgi:UDP-glucose 4-epimerase
MSVEKWVAITGCSGYIGGQTVLRFKDLGYKVLGVDNSTEGSWIRKYLDVFVPGDFTNAIFINQMIDKNPVALIHIAGTSLVGPSMADPGPYFHNNVGNTARLLSMLAKRGWKKTVVYSSSAAVYGESGNGIFDEYSLTAPVSPYGQSKLMAEQVLRDCAKGYGFKTIALRYFNACGADSKTRSGQVKNSTHVIARIMETIIHKGVFTLNGDNYDTPDGTCVRDYLHVGDIANAHYLAVKYGETMEKSSVEFNLGTGKGTSIRDIITSVEKITGRMVLNKVGPKRAGDPATLIAVPFLFKRETGWKSDASDIDNIIRTAWDWYNSQDYQIRK